MTNVKKACESYLGNRGISHRSIKRCGNYKDMWFIIFNDYPEDVEISFILKMKILPIHRPKID